jgi:hypothetical protein
MDRLNERKHVPQFALPPANLGAVKRTDSVFVSIDEMNAQNAFCIRRRATKAAEAPFVRGRALFRRLQEERLRPCNALIVCF